MNKKEEQDAEELVEEVDKPEEKEEPKKPVMLGQVATAHENVYMTPGGNFGTEEYLVWLGNTIWEVKEALVGNK